MCCTFGVMHAGFWWENRGVDGRINIKMDIKDVWERVKWIWVRFKDEWRAAVQRGNEDLGSMMRVIS